MVFTPHPPISDTPFPSGVVRLHACLTLASVGMVFTSSADVDSPVLLGLGVSLSAVALFLMW
eukprot:scaffold2462_cov121-Isochrysis_galbana.AAC.1